MKGDMLEKKISKHALKTQQTRALLLQSAETVFVRDGYEGAELGEIAALAGRTKGAIYAHFKSKEDIFLALVVQRTARYRAQMAEMLAGSTSIVENLAALRKLYLKLSEDRTWALLNLEFKLFALRHPESKAKLQRYLDEVLPGKEEKRFVHLLGSAGKGKNALGRLVAIQLLHPLLSAIAVEAEFSPDLLDERTVKKVANRIFDAFIEGDGAPGTPG